MDELVEPIDVEMVPAVDDSKTVDSDQGSVKTFNSNNVQVPEVKKSYRYSHFTINLLI